MLDHIGITIVFMIM